jgi:hypothetical protein
MPATEVASSASSDTGPSARLAQPARTTLPSRPTSAPGARAGAAFNRELLNRHRRRLTHLGELPSLKELELLLKLERELEAQETLERLNALTREVS